MSVSVTRAYFIIIMKYEIEWYRVTYVSIVLGDVSFFYGLNGLSISDSVTES